MMKRNLFQLLKIRHFPTMMAGLLLALPSFAEEPLGTIEFNRITDARASNHHTRQSNNILFQIPANSRGEILEARNLPSGNVGLRTRITSGPHENRTVWVYYRRSNPSMTLTKAPPTSVTTTAVSSAAVCRNCSTAQRPAETRPLQNFTQNLTQQVSQSPVVGAYRVMANMYQSCSVLNLPPYNNYNPEHNQMNRYIQTRSSQGQRLRVVQTHLLDEIASTHYYLRDIDNSNNPQCRDMKQNPPVYHYGGRPSFPDRNTINIHGLRRTGGQPVTGIDCSAFVSAAYSVSGLKFTPATSSASNNLVTSTTLLGFNENNSCFQKPQFTRDQTITSGDIVTIVGHTFMIDQVGHDPFGIERALQSGHFPRTAASCSRYQPDLNTLNFTLIQSTGTGNYPAMRTEAKNHRDSKMIGAYLRMARQACQAHYEGQAAMPPRTPGFSLLRHKGAAAPQCLFTDGNKPQMLGEECTQGCLNERT